MEDVTASQGSTGLMYGLSSAYPTCRPFASRERYFSRWQKLNHLRISAVERIHTSSGLPVLITTTDDFFERVQVLR